MKTASVCLSNRRLCLGILALLSLFSPARARAGLTYELHLVRFQAGQAYKFYTPLYPDTNGPAPACGTYFISSPLFSAAEPTNGSWREIQITTNGPNTLSGIENSYPDFGSLMAQITNGDWTIVFTNETVTNTYTFTVTASGITSDMLPATMITYPTQDELDIPNQPAMTWTGPTNWGVFNNTYLYNYDFSFFQYASLAATQENWTVPVTVPDGMNCTFQLQYLTNYASAIFSVSTPLDPQSNPLPGWDPTNVLETGDQVAFAITNPPVAGALLVAHYPFNNMANPGQDTSGNGYDLDYNGGDGVVVTNDAVTGGGAALFDGFSFFTYNNTPTNVLNTLAGDFSLSFWIKTTEDDGNEGGPAFDGAGIVAADIPGSYNDLVPAALDGGEIGFNTGGPEGDDTVNSDSDINDGNYHHVVITRTESTGEKDIYIDGVLDNSDFATMNPLSDPRSLAVGCATDASQTSPNNLDPYQYFQFFQGTLDDMQLYAGVLNSNQVALLFNNPGLTITGAAPGANGLVAHYDFDEGTVLAPDVSGNGNNIVYAGNFGGAGPAISPIAVAGAGSVSFDGGSFLTAPSNLLATLAHSFSVSLWVLTTQATVADPGFVGANGIVSADIPGGYNDLIPVAMDQYGEIVFNTGNVEQGYDDRMVSLATVNDGHWHQVVVTRDQTTGNKDIYVDGTLDVNSPGPGTTNDLSDPVLLTLGAIADASNPDPTSPSYTSLNGYSGLVDDIQIYDHVLSSNDVVYLYGHPGIGIGGPDTNDESLSVAFNIVRNQDPFSGDEYFCFPFIQSQSPTPTTVDEVDSPDGSFSGQLGSAGSDFIFSLDDLQSEITNGLWTAYINKGEPGELRFYFSVSLSGLDPNTLPAVDILSPANNSTGISASPACDWSGPADYQGIFAQVGTNNIGLLTTNLPGTATNWSPGIVLPPGTNQFYLNYFTNNVGYAAFTTPVDSYTNAIDSWSAEATLNTEATVNFVVSGGAVLLLNPQIAGASFQFQFPTQAGQTNIVQSRTNLILGEWADYTNIIGDGTLQTVTLPVGGASAMFFRLAQP